ncbi:hypothetical protein [Winogradskyella sp.]|uniref:alpha/beta hydrolase family protein n=1 Tax=Winogradskyella sp. TaxID=1883156 RepID=UPI00261BD18A|nr:hypothetical protein [Winogradskyella sp.]
MKNTLLLLTAFLLVYVLNGQDMEDLERGILMKVNAQPDKGFHYDYLIFLPKNIEKDKKHYLLVETNNTGFPTDSSELHERSAKKLASGHYFIGNWVSQKMGIPLVVPIFPRPQSKALVYTHTLDRDAILIQDVKYKRLDLQLMRIIEHAKDVLRQRDYSIHEKIFMNGFSASGSFINRFAFLHPEIIKALATGGLNGILMLPQEQLAGKELNYPLGIKDFEAIMGTPFDFDAYKDISQFIYMGTKDTNDAVKYDDAYNNKERAIIYHALSESMLPERWEKCQLIYKLHGVNAEFRTYDHVGHGTPFSVLWEIVEFFKRNNKI